MKSVKTEHVLFGIGAIVWCVIYANIGPQSLSIDFFQFKDPAINLITGHGFMMVSDPGNPTITPQLYSVYPPIYPLLYSAFVSVFGISAYANTYFNFFFQVIRALLLTEVLVVILMKNAPKWLRIVTTLLIVAVIPLNPQCDRPEDLVLVLFLLSVLALLKIKGNQKIFWAYAIAGVTLTVSPFGGILNLAYVFASHVYEKCRDGFRLESVKSEWKPILGAAIVPGIALASYFAVDGTAFIERFLKLSVHGSNFGYLKQENPYMIAYRELRFGIMMFLVAIGSLSFFSFRHGMKHTSERTIWMLIAILFIAISLTTLAVFPNKNHYMYLVCTATIVMFAYFSNGQDIPQRNLLLLTAFILMIPISRQNVVKMVYTRYKNIKAYEAAMTESRKLYDTLIKDKDVYIGLSMMPENPYFFLKPIHPKMCNVDNLTKEDVQKLEYVILGSASNVPGERVTNPPRTLNMNDFELLYTVDGALKPESAFEGKMIRPDDSWGYEVYKRKAQ